MELSVSELAYVRAQGVYVTQKCDGCGKFLNRSLCFTISGKREVYCSAACRELIFFSDRREAKKHAAPGTCAYCGGSLRDKKRGAFFCGDKCRKRARRTGTGERTAEVAESRTPVESNEQLTNAEIGR